MVLHLKSTLLSTLPSSQIRAAVGLSLGLLMVYLSLTQFSSTTRGFLTHIYPHNSALYSYQRVGDLCGAPSVVTDDILVILKTGASEAHHRLPAHAATELACIPRFIVVSDLEEEIAGLHIEDVLKDYPKGVRNRPEFGYYDVIQAQHDAHESVNTTLDAGADHKEDKLAWKLDKWKFIPQIEAAVNQYPSKWYVFIEADTFLVWSNLLHFLERYDPTEEYYIGSHNIIGDISFAHGGSGFVISDPLAQTIVSWADKNRDRLYQLTDITDCGDCVIGSVVGALEFDVTVAWPHIQGETPESLDYTSHHWCYPVVTFHHMSPAEIAAVWQFEQAWTEKRPILHMDIYHHLVQPLLVERKDDWDNGSGRELLAEEGKNPGESFEECQNACEKDSRCVQFSWRQGSCRTEDLFRFGVSSGAGLVTSGFLLDRVREYIKNLGKCDDIEWQDPHLL